MIGPGKPKRGHFRSLYSLGIFGAITISLVCFFIQFGTASAKGRQGPTDPFGNLQTDSDTDDDRVTDDKESHLYFTNPFLRDTDADGLDDRAEIVFQTDPLNPDTDGDGMPDGWELFFDLDPLNPLEATQDKDNDGLTNLQEYLDGSNPHVKDSDNDGYDDLYEATHPPRDPVVHEEPLVFAVFPPVAKPGDTLTILGYRLGDTVSQTVVEINGRRAELLPGSSETNLKVRVPSRADRFRFPPIRIIATYQGVQWSSTAPHFPFKVTGDEEIPELQKDPTEIAEGRNVYGRIMLGESDAYRFNLSDRSVINVSVKAFDALDNRVLEGGTHDPDTYLQVLRKTGSVVAGNDNFGNSTNSALPGLVLEGGTYTIQVTVPRAEAGNTSRGYYSLRFDRIASPFITDISPAIGRPGEIVTISGCNFGAAIEDNRVQFVHGRSRTSAQITHASAASLTIQVPSLQGQPGQGYSVVVTNLVTGLGSQEKAVAAHNAPAIFYLLDHAGYVPERVFGAGYLSSDQTAVGYTGEGRGRFIIEGSKGETILAKMIFAQPFGEANPAGQPRVSLIAPDGNEVPLHPLDPPTSKGIGQDLYTLPQYGKYTLVAQGTQDGIHPGFYQLSFERQEHVAADRMEILSGDHQIIPVVSGGETILGPLKVRVTYQGKAVAHAPVIFQVIAPLGQWTQDHDYLFFTDANGDATATGLVSPKPPLQGQVLAHVVWTRAYAKFHFVLVPAFSPRDWDGDGLTNTEEGNTLKTDPTNPFHKDAQGNLVLDGYPLSGDTTQDWDGDDLENKLEIYLGTDPHRLDMDEDGYPDGFEIKNILDPFTRETSKIEFIPLGFTPNYDEDVILYVLARDPTGHFRAGVVLTAKEHNFLESKDARLSQGFSASGTDGRGIDFCQVHTANQPDGTGEYYFYGKQYPSLGYRYYLTASTDSATDTIYFIAVPQMF